MSKPGSIHEHGNGSSPSSASAVTDSPPALTESAKHGLRFWLVFVALSLSVSVGALEIATISTALPTIIHDLGGGSSFIWVGSVYTLCATAVIPFTGSMAELVGRRPVMLVSLALMAAGCAICGAAHSMTVMIAGRVVQGLGSGGILAANVIIIADLVPLQDRGKYNALVSIPWSVCNGIGPVVSGALTQKGQWRWLFFLNLPLLGVAALLFLTCLRVPTPQGTIREKMGRVDWVGNLLVVGASISTVIALTWGGVAYSWSSPQVLATLIVGVLGLAAFLVYEALFAKNPVVPFELMGTITSSSGYVQIFVMGVVMMILVYYMPIYFQAAKGQSVLDAGINMLPFALLAVPLGSIAAISVKRTQTYRPQLWLAWALLVLCGGLMIMVRDSSPTGYMLGFASLGSMALGILITTLYFPVLAPLPTSKNASALAYFMFLRNFAQVWGVSIGGAILQNALAKRLPAEIVNFVPAENASALQFAVIPLIHSLPSELQEQVRKAFGDSLKYVWISATAFAAVGLVASLPMRLYRLHTTVDDAWAYQDKADEKASAADLS